MDGRAAFLRVGLLIVAATAALIGLVWFFGGARTQHGRLFETYFGESVQGLEVGAAVKYRGVTLGQVKEIGLVSAVYGQGEDTSSMSSLQLVYVRFEVDMARVGNNVDPLDAVANGLRTRLASQGITGVSYIEIDFVSPARFPALKVPWQPKADYIPSMPSTFTQVQDSAQRILAKLETVNLGAIADGLTGLIGDLRGELKDGQARATLSSAQQLLDTLRGAVSDADIPALAADLRSTSGAVRGVVEGKPTRDLIATLSLAADRLAQAATRLPALIAAMEATVRRVDAGTADVQRDLVPLLRDARAAAANLRDTSEALRRYPAQVLLGGPPPRPESSR